MAHRADGFREGELFSPFDHEALNFSLEGDGEDTPRPLRAETSCVFVQSHRNDGFEKIQMQGAQTEALTDARPTKFLKTQMIQTIKIWGQTAIAPDAGHSFHDRAKGYNALARLQGSLWPGFRPIICYNKSKIEIWLGTLRKNGRSAGGPGEIFLFFPLNPRILEPSNGRLSRTDIDKEAGSAAFSKDAG